MRADRLLAILLTLQSRQRLTAGELAERLGVSLRTVQRDMLALSMAGAPVYAERGVGGGWSLLPGYHTDLSGLSSAEAHALTVQAPARVLDDLGLRQASATALLKLLSGLSEAQRRAAEDIRRRVYVDAAGWRTTSESTPAFALIQEAVWRDVRVRIRYQHSDGGQVERDIEPLGLVAKGRVWYVVALADGEYRSYRMSRILEAALLDIPATRPEDFDLGAYWETSQEQFAASLPRYEARARILAERLPFARAMWRYTQIASVSEPNDEGWVTATIDFETRREACFCLLGLGADAEVLAPDDLREAIASAEARIAERRQRAE